MAANNRKRKSYPPVPVWVSPEPVSKKQRLYKEYLKMSLDTEKKLLEYEEVILEERRDLVKTKHSKKQRSTTLSKIAESELKKAREAERKELEKVNGIRESVKRKKRRLRKALIKTI